MSHLPGLVAAGTYHPGVSISPVVQTVLSRKQYEQRTDAWYEVRKGLITASDAGGALGIPAFKGQRNPRQDCLKQKTTGQFTGNHMTRHGQQYEDEVRERAMQAMGECAWEVGLLVHDSYPWLGASPDGITSSGRLIEIKCPYKRKPIPHHVPHVYYAQIQVQLEVTDLNECIFIQWQPAWLAPDGEEVFCMIMVERDRQWFADRVDKLWDFHQELMACRAAYVPPPPPPCLIVDDLYGSGDGSGDMSSEGSGDMSSEGSGDMSSEGSSDESGDMSSEGSSDESGDEYPINIIYNTDRCSPTDQSLHPEPRPDQQRPGIPEPMYIQPPDTEPHGTDADDATTSSPRPPQHEDVSSSDTMS